MSIVGTVSPDIYKDEALAGNLVAQNYLGDMHYGKKTIEDYKQAFYWYELSAKQGNAYGQIFLGHMYYHGRGTLQDFKQSFYWSELSAKQGNEYGQNMLGHIYTCGKGTSQDYKQAFHWWELSAKQGNKEGQKTLGDMYYHGKGTLQDSKQAFYWYELSAKQGNKEAQIIVGDMYRDGLGTEKNILKAYKYYKSIPENEGYTRMTSLINNNTKQFIMLIDELKDKSKKRRKQIEELEITAPITGGPEYIAAKERYDTYKKQKTTIILNTETSIITGLDE